ncbi:MAG: hypothetical protein WC372_04605 [Candidatus Neomarinimicrobiota bacterium]|jgi:uncharacterized repeat protein (TIGR01451 family)|nr:hypothetical protein [Candidatus Neomarinimicrobiota bacterium]MDD3966223.1 hypothetical protein [Candidatus Neomarinimicrobiota bacterium]MDX9781225.1 hypothetical protein [bacterium]
MKPQKISGMLALVITTALLMAQGTPKLELNISEKKVNMTAAERSGKTAIVYRPGDVIHYTITAENSGDGIMTNPVVTDPVPAGTAYLPLTAKGRDTAVSFSINGGISYQNWPPTYLVKDADGKETLREATPEMVTHIRWEFRKALAPKERKALEFDVKVK